MSKSVKVIDDLSVREVYSNRLVASSTDGAVLMLTLACGRSLPEQAGERPAEPSPVVINNRLALPDSVVIALHTALGNAIQVMLKRKVEHARSVLADVEAIEKPRN